MWSWWRRRSAMSRSTSGWRNFMAAWGTKLKGVLTESPEQFDPAVVDLLSGALDHSIEDYFIKVFARYAFRETVREFFETYDLLLSPVLAGRCFRYRSQRAAGVGGPQPRFLGLLYLSLQHDRPAGGLHSRLVLPNRACRSGCRWSGESIPKSIFSVPPRHSRQHIRGPIKGRH